jgi:hypothetical protein
VYVIASVFNQPTSSATYTLSLDLPVAGDSCASPAPLVLAPGPNAFTGLTTTSHGKDAQLTAMSCRPSSGPDAVYLITVPTGRTLVASTTSTADVVLNLVSVGSTCTPTTVCLAAADQALAGQAETLTWNNGGSGPRDVLLVVSAQPNTPMAYGLTVSVQ